jgi:hypothetical protein
MACDRKSYCLRTSENDSANPVSRNFGSGLF